MAHGSTLGEIARILGLATILGLAGQWLRQPLVIMFLATGILAGPACLGIIESHGQIELFANIGISLLLFVVGLRLDPHLIRTTGPVALATGVGQIVFTAVIGFGLCLGLGMGPLEAAYVAVALTFSSTIIIVKLLSDKKEIDSLHGRIALGFLIVQDIAAILALVGLTTLGSQLAGDPSATASPMLLATRGVLFLLGVAASARWILPGLTQHIAGSPETLSLFAITWAVVLGALSEALGFSKEVGAFVAGVALASTGYREAIGGRLTTLRDFLLLFFFIDLGARLDWASVGAQLSPSLLLSVFVLVGNPLIVMIIMGFMGYRRRTGFMAGLTVAQISEFSLIVGALGVQLGHLSAERMGLITLVGVITIFASTYLILYSGPLYERLSGILKVFERRHPYREATGLEPATLPELDIILVGLGRYGGGIAGNLLRRGKSVLGIDFDPDALEHWQKQGLPVLYGDIGDPEFHDSLPPSRWVVSTVRSRETSLLLLKTLHGDSKHGKLAMTAATKDEAEFYERVGAHTVLRPFRDAAEQAVDTLTHAMELLPEHIDWPIAFREVRIRQGSVAAGHALREVPVRSQTGASILAVSRGGHVEFAPGPDHRILAGDRLVVMGGPDEVSHAQDFLDHPVEIDGRRKDLERFVLAEVEVGPESERIGTSLADLRFRQVFDATVVGIRRDEEQIRSPGPDTTIQRGDHLIVIGGAAAIQRLKEVGAL